VRSFFLILKYLVLKMTQLDKNQPDVNSIELGNLKINNSGTKTIPIQWDGCELKPVYWIPLEPLKVIWNPKGYDDSEANRVTVCMEPNNEVEEFVEELDDRIIDMLQEHSSLYFGKGMTRDEIKLLYLSPIRVSSSKNYKTLRAKFTLQGKNQLLCWDDNRQLTKPAADWCGCMIKPRFLLRGLWISGNQVGVVLEMTDVRFMEIAPIECPF